MGDPSAPQHNQPSTPKYQILEFAYLPVASRPTMSDLVVARFLNVPHPLGVSVRFANQRGGFPLSFWLL